MPIDQRTLQGLIGPDEQAERIAKYAWDHAAAGFRVDLLVEFFLAMHGDASLHERNTFFLRIFRTAIWENAVDEEAKKDPEAAMKTLIETSPEPVARALLDSQAKTLTGFVASTSETLLLNRRGFGQTSLMTLVKTLERHGLKLSKIKFREC